MTDCGVPLHDCSTDTGELTLAGWSMHSAAWCCVDLSELLSGPQVRGDSILVERLDGQIGRRRRPDETEYALPFVFTGFADRLGVEHGDANVGLALNREAFHAQVVTLQLIDVELTEPGGRVLAGQGIGLRLEWTVRPRGLALASLRLVIPTPLAEVA